MQGCKFGNVTFSSASAYNCVPGGANKNPETIISLDLGLKFNTARAEYFGPICKCYFIFGFLKWNFVGIDSATNLPFVLLKS